MCIMESLLCLSRQNVGLGPANGASEHFFCVSSKKYFSFRCPFRTCLFFPFQVLQEQGHFLLHFSRFAWFLGSVNRPTEILFV